MTRITIVMPVYNAMPYLREAVEALLHQTYSEFSLIAVDDCSTDASYAYLKAIDDPRITLLQTRGRQGQGAARNMAMELCTTEFLAFADADDVSFPNRLECQLAYMDQHPDVGMLGTHFSFLAGNGQTGMTPSLAMDHDTIRRDLMLCRHAVANCTLMFRTEALKALGGFRIDGAGEDWDLFLRMTEHTKVANLPDVLCLYRVHATSTAVEQASTLQKRYAHACECAELRRNSMAETTFEDFCRRQAERPLHVRFAERLGTISGVQYRRAVAEVLSGNKVRGYARLAYAAVISPNRLIQRVAREVREKMSLRHERHERARQERLQEEG